MAIHKNQINCCEFGFNSPH